MAIEQIQNKEAFKEAIAAIESQAGYRKPVGFGICRVDRGQKNRDKILQAVFPVVNWHENYGSAAVFIAALQESGQAVDFAATEGVFDVNDAFIINALKLFHPFVAEAVGEAHRNVQVLKELARQAECEELDDNFRVVFLFEDAAPKSVEAVYLKLYALSLNKAPLRGVNLDGAFGLLHNCAWFGNEPFELDWLRENEIELKLGGAYPEIESVDKFPRYLQHIIPSDNTRILDSAKVRMGAQLAAGTTVMPGASYINFNAGTTGPVMVEGRISSSAIVGPGSDVGGGASILGVLSGTNGNPVSIGRNVLLGANSVTGIPLGDGCIVDAGIAVLEGTKFVISGRELEKIKEVNPDWDVEVEEENIFKGIELAGKNGIHFRQESTTGRMIAMRSRREVKLNEALH
ncbi:tetrahydrodipicolinate N-succinyltransferase N-terminal domain-containing protein [Hydrogenimonas sp.]